MPCAHIGQLFARGILPQLKPPSNDVKDTDFLPFRGIGAPDLSVRYRL